MHMFMYIYVGHITCLYPHIHRSIFCSKCTSARSFGPFGGNEQISTPFRSKLNAHTIRQTDEPTHERVSSCSIEVKVMLTFPPMPACWPMLAIMSYGGS